MLLRLRGNFPTYQHVLLDSGVTTIGRCRPGIISCRLESCQFCVTPPIVERGGCWQLPRGSTHRAKPKRQLVVHFLWGGDGLVGASWRGRPFFSPLVIAVFSAGMREHRGPHHLSGSDRHLRIDPLVPRPNSARSVTCRRTTCPRRDLHRHRCP